MDDQQTKFLQIFEAAKKSLIITDYLYRNLFSDLEEIESLVDTSKQVDVQSIPPFVKITSIIDFAHRYQSLLDAMPMINKRSPQLKRLRQKLENVEKVRHHLQHMRSDLSNALEKQYAILGSLSWSQNTKSYTLFLSQANDRNAHSLVYDTKNGTWTTCCAYTINNITVDIDEVVKEMHTAYKWLLSKVHFEPPEFAELNWGRANALSFEIK